jgi:hypothetical protein
LGLGFTLDVDLGHSPHGDHTDISLGFHVGRVLD